MRLHGHINVQGETPKIEKNPTKQTEFLRAYPNLFAPLQMEAYERIRDDGSNLALVAPTSSGKTLAVSAGLFENKAPTVFVYPFRALALDQTLELIRIGKLFGIEKEQFGSIVGGTTEKEIAEALEGKNYILATPDKLVTLFSTHNRFKHSAAITILKKYSFVFDEIHAYNALMLTSLKYFIRSVREFRPDMRGFYFLSATFPEQTWSLFEAELGMTTDDRITGDSYTGDIKLLIEPEKNSKSASQGIARMIREYKMNDHCVAIFNTALRAWEVSREFGAKLFIGQDKMPERTRVKRPGYNGDN